MGMNPWIGVRTESMYLSHLTLLVLTTAQYRALNL
jgi:hypothetical protein